MNRRLLLPFAFALSILAPALAQSAVAAKAGKAKVVAVAPSPPAAAPCTQFFLGGQPPTGGSGDRLICHSFYVISYSTTLRDPVWTSYLETKAMAEGGDHFPRLPGPFASDAALPAAQQGADHDYTNANPHFDRGHLTPANDAEDMPHQSDTFMITNVVPQNGPLNEHLWANLELAVHRLAEAQDQVFIVTGATFAANPPLMHRPGEQGRIAVPNATFKAIYVPSLNVAVGFLAPNAAPGTACTIMSIAELTRRTGVNPFPSLPAATTARIPASFTLPMRAPRCMAAAH